MRSPRRRPCTGCLTRIRRGTYLIGKLAQALVLVGIVFPRLEPSRRDSLIAQWCREVLDLLQIHVVIHGEIPAAPLSSTVFVANHISWIDILLLLSWQPMRFIAKKEVKGWPIIGYLASQTGTWFFKRTSPHELADVMRATSLALHQGGCIAFFPEGTTTDGTSVRPFHSGLFESAIRANAPVRPVGISYLKPDGSPDTGVAFVGDESLVSSILNVLSRPTTIARLSFSPPIDGSMGDRRRLAALCQKAVERSLADPATFPLGSNASPLPDAHGSSSPVAAA
ncbi:MAG: 1-acyl-sn-glycerol-3-phosphate acyltransferase [Nitrospira sp.]|nr:1-acyl-sn-glycerol-3-phosphate acyltransferase [Nitrospira sp.]MCP9465386.1 1-acyl-sn-glycerol-3-phosphate acyltransferase [Nitrospira sp.]